ncbi:hypothetical protein ACTPEF_23690, partial [Clostridioides difficile]
DKNSVEVTENLPTAVQEENFDIMEYTNNKKNELRKSKEVEALHRISKSFNGNECFNKISCRNA